MQNILLTGKRQVGKSTIINQVIENFSGKICGFKTLWDEEDERFYITSLDENNQAYICKKNKDNRWTGLTDTFDKQGVAILQKCLKQSPDLIIMDELGFFEDDSILFQNKVFECLDSGIPVLGVLKDKRSKFLDSIQNLPNLTVYTVTEQNRNQVLDKVRCVTKGSSSITLSR